jgi:hypothetical protein
VSKATGFLTGFCAVGGKQRWGFGLNSVEVCVIHKIMTVFALSLKSV